MTPTKDISLVSHKMLFVAQKRELAELFGFETRNRYQVLDGSKQLVAYVAEQQKGWLGFVLRQFIGHWRSFTLSFFTPEREVFMTARHPFRFFFQRLEVMTAQGTPLGALQQRWAIFSKRFDVENERGGVILTVSSPLWKPWTFPFSRNGKPVASVKKKWSGALTEVFTDKDTFAVEFDPSLMGETERKLVLAAALFIDLQYFEAKAGH